LRAKQGGIYRRKKAGEEGGNGKKSVGVRQWEMRKGKDTLKAKPSMEKLQKDMVKKMLANYGGHTRKG